MIEQTSSTVFKSNAPTPVSHDNILTCVTENKSTNAYLIHIDALRDRIWRELEVDPIIEPIDAQLSYLECRAIGQMDKYFDTHRAEFNSVMSNSAKLVTALGHIQLGHKYGSSFTFGEMMNALEAKLGDPTIHPDEEARTLLSIRYRRLLQAIELLSLEHRIVTMSDRQVFRLKMGTNTAHALMMFDIECVRKIQTVPREVYRTARTRYLAGVLSYQIIDDLRDYTLDGIEQNANLWRVLARHYGEASDLPASHIACVDPNNTDSFDIQSLLAEAERIMPNTHRHLYSLHRKLESKAQQ